MSLILFQISDALFFYAFYMHTMITLYPRRHMLSVHCTISTTDISRSILSVNNIKLKNNGHALSHKKYSKGNMIGSMISLNVPK